jgi:hypothetical protein
VSFRLRAITACPSGTNGFVMTSSIPNDSSKSLFSFNEIAVNANNSSDVKL